MAMQQKMMKTVVLFCSHGDCNSCERLEAVSPERGSVSPPQTVWRCGDTLAMAEVFWWVVLRVMETMDGINLFASLLFPGESNATADGWGPGKRDPAENPGVFW